MELSLGGVLDTLVVERGALAQGGKESADGVLAVLGLDPAEAQGRP